MPRDPIFQEAVTHRPRRGRWSGYRVFGRNLLPFSLWHEYLLEEVASPLLSRDGALTAQEIDLAVSVCQCVFPQVDYSVRWSGQLLWHAAGGGIKKAAREFIEYLNDYLATPKYTVVEREAKGPPPPPRGRPPAMFSMVSAIVKHTGWDDAKVWNMEAGYGRWWEAMAIESAGTELDFHDHKKDTFREKMIAAEEAKEAAKLAAQKGST